MYERTCQCVEPDPTYKGICANCEKPMDTDAEVRKLMSDADKEKDA